MKEKIYWDRLAELEIYPDYISVDGDYVLVKINWGDWKHDHARLDLVMEANFTVMLVDVKITESDGSDCYSALHIYKMRGGDE